MRRQLDKVGREIQAIVDAIKRATFSPALQRELAALEARQSDLVRQAEVPPPNLTIHPNAAEIYRKKIADLHAALAAPDTRGEAVEALRGLIEVIRVTPEGDGNVVELAGELAALLGLGGNKNAASIEEAARSGLLVAGEGFEPSTFRL
jgi:site-specific DNA recombinase